MLCYAVNFGVKQSLGILWPTVEDDPEDRGVNLMKLACACVDSGGRGRTYHLGLSSSICPRSRMMELSKPSFHSRDCSAMCPYKSSVGNTFGLRCATRTFRWGSLFPRARDNVFQQADLPAPAGPMTNTQCRIANSSSSCATFNVNCWSGHRPESSVAFVMHRARLMSTTLGGSTPGNKSFNKPMKDGFATERHHQGGMRTKENHFILPHDLRYVEIAKCAHQKLFLWQAWLSSLKMTRYNKNWFNSSQTPIIMPISSSVNWLRWNRNMDLINNTALITTVLKANHAVTSKGRRTWTLNFERQHIPRPWAYFHLVNIRVSQVATVLHYGVKVLKPQNRL